MTTRERASRPPRPLERLLAWMTPPLEREPLLGDFEECFERLAGERGRIRAMGWYSWSILKLAPEFFKNSIHWRTTMFINDLKTGRRHMAKHKGYAFINLAGLALGLTCVLLILLWVQNEMSYDRFRPGAEALFRVEQDQKFAGGTFHVWDVPFLLGPALKAEIPEVEDAVRSYRYFGSVLVRLGEQAFYEGGAAAVDASFLGMFGLPLVRGDAASALVRPDGLVLSEELAQKYFGRRDPVGQTLVINNAHSFTVAGVMKDAPENSMIRPKLLLPFDYTKTLGLYDEDWHHNSVTTWVRLRAGADQAAVNATITRLVRGRRGDAAPVGGNGRAPDFMLRPLVGLKMNQTFGYGQAIGSAPYVAVFSAVALFVLLIACVNFMNLATARSANRAKEVGLRKVVGASRRSLARQFYAESIATAVMAAAASLLLVVMLLPAFNTLAGTKIAAGALARPFFLLGLLAIAIVTGLVSGSYPAAFLSAFQPVRTLKGRLNSGAKSAAFRKTLVVAQFALSILLLLGTAVVYRQLEFMRAKKLGYDKEHLVYMPLRGDSSKQYAVLKDRLLQAPRVLNVTGTSLRPTRMVGDTSGGADWDGRDPNNNPLLGETSVDYDFPETLGIEMAAGRPFSRSFAGDAGAGYLVNEEVVKIMGLDAAAAVGKRFSFVFEGTIVGVMKNFHLQSVREAIEPRVFIIDPASLHYAVVRLRAGDIPAAIEDLRRAWLQVNPLYPFEFQFFDADFEQMYLSDERMGTILKIFSAMALAIACLGLFGLVAFAAEQRTKEIGIRKVLGARGSNIVGLMSGEFIPWVGIANLIAWPAGYLIMRKWLQGFAFRTDIAWWLFPAAGAGALVLALLTVGVQAVRAARTQPAKALKYE